MSIGIRIKRIRNFRGLTQKALGLAVGFGEETADIRIAQYETNIRTPKESKLRSIAEALQINVQALHEPTLYDPESIMHMLFELDKHYPLSLCDAGENRGIGVCISSHTVNGFLKEWQLRKRELIEGTITGAEYMEWELNWPQTIDEGGMKQPDYPWRIERTGE